MGTNTGADHKEASKSKSNTPIPIIKTTATPTSGSLFDNFADFDTFSTKSNSSTMESTKKSNTTKTTADPFLDAFNDNFETISNKSLDSNSNPLKGDAFDAFGTTATSKKSTAFDAAFGDSFKPAAATTQVAAMFDDAFNDNFEDDFFKSSNLTKDTNITTSKDTNLNNNQSKLHKSPLPFNDNDFAKFDAFGTSSEDDFNNSANTASNLNNSMPRPKYSLNKTDNLIKVQNKLTVNNTDKTAVTSNVENGAKLPEKFVADYSKPETFDDDLQEAIKRSMVDQ